MPIFDLLTKSLIVYSSNSKFVARRVTLVVALAFCPKILGTWWGPMNGILSVCECSMSIQYCHRWWANSKPNCYNLMFLQSQVTSSSNLPVPLWPIAMLADGCRPNEKLFWGSYKWFIPSFPIPK